jgi:alkanesulfonate monooxygenase SsuD/methylene tetrahydromethanopterin reductase-like flavin-dependent oxidoreductase (luciferase family)
MTKTAILIGRELGLPDDERAQLVKEAAALGYHSAWTNSGPDAVGIASCRRWFKDCGILTGTAVIPTPTANQDEISRAARELTEESGGKFILGIGAGNMIDPAWRAANNLPADARPVGMMRDHITRFKRETGAPIYLAALGPNLLELIGEIADGALPNWMDPSQIAWARERIAVGAARTGRDPSQILIGQSVRICVDDDVDAARRVMATQALDYSLAKPGQPAGGHYRANMARMGLDEQFKKLEAMRDAGAPKSELADAFPEEALSRIAAWGKPKDVKAGIKRLSEGLDIANIRISVVTPGAESVRRAVQVAAPTA